MGDNKIRSLAHTIYKNKFHIHQRLNEGTTIKLLEENIGRHSLGPWGTDGFLKSEKNNL